MFPYCYRVNLDVVAEREWGKPGNTDLGLEHMRSVDPVKITGMGYRGDSPRTSGVSIFIGSASILHKKAKKVPKQLSFLPHLKSRAYPISALKRHFQKKNGYVKFFW